jgi:Protein of unknown function (DUF1176)
MSTKSTMDDRSKAQHGTCSRHVMLAILSFVMMACGPATAYEPGSVQVFGNWAVGCDNTRYCDAVSLNPPGDEEEQSVSIVIWRSGEAKAQPEIALDVDAGAVPNAARGAAAAFALDGQRIDTMFLDRDGRLVPIVSGSATPFLNKIRTRAVLSVLASGGVEIGRVSLDGLSEALAEMDRRQHRAGNRTAIVLKGDGFYTDITPVPLQPVVNAIARSAKPPFAAPPELIKAQLNRFGCSTFDSNPEAAWTQRLDDKTTLLSVPDPCSVGMYNTSFRLLLIGDDQSTRAAHFDTFADAEQPDIVLNAFWDRIENMLSSRARGRSLGDCGILLNYVWDGHMFRLVRREDMPTCRGSRSLIRTWSARVVTP